VHSAALHLSASVAEIFTCPVLQQFIRNRIDDVVTFGVGLPGSAAALGQSIAMIPRHW
jgi:hypothetical protein